MKNKKLGLKCFEWRFLRSKTIRHFFIPRLLGQLYAKQATYKRNFL
jgi:hypothetical protein